MLPIYLKNQGSAGFGTVAGSGNIYDVMKTWSFLISWTCFPPSYFILFYLLEHSCFTMFVLVSAVQQGESDTWIHRALLLDFLPIGHSRALNRVSFPFLNSVTQGILIWKQQKTIMASISRNFIKGFS